ncbi:MAG: RecX family transcriptional regulator [Candidatus Dormibacteraeota bacterium]|nr:RecX family transcriptional regulator [Candidatus Dormibacteraeota bacterium]
MGRGAEAGKTDATARAIGLLARRAHSQSELRQKLRQKGYEPEAIDATMARLGELGYLDDQDFARGLVRRRGSTRGPLALSAELAAKGVSPAEAGIAVAEFDAEAQLLSATNLAERLYARKTGMGYREMLDGIGVKLLRRGFPVPIVRAACRSVLERTED